MPFNQMPTDGGGGGGGTLRWKGTLVRPERYVNPPPLLRTVTLKGANRVHGPNNFKPYKEPFRCWGFFAKVCTFCVPPFLMSLCGIKGKGPQQAWREKVTLFLISLIMCAGVLFFVVGLNPLFCPQDENRLPAKSVNSAVVLGKIYDVRTGNPLFKRAFANIPVFNGEDIRKFYNIPLPKDCEKLDPNVYKFLQANLGCKNDGSSNTVCLNYPDDLPSLMTKFDDGTKASPDAFYDWDEVRSFNLNVFNGVVVNLDTVYDYINSLPKSQVDSDDILRTLNFSKDRTDISRDLITLREFLDYNVRSCFIKSFYAGRLNSLRPSCFFASSFSIIVSIIILAALISRLAMAIIFDWFLSNKLSSNPPPPHSINNNQRQIANPHSNIRGKFAALTNLNNIRVFSKSTMSLDTLYLDNNNPPGYKLSHPHDNSPRDYDYNHDNLQTRSPTQRPPYSSSLVPIPQHSPPNPHQIATTPTSMSSLNQKYSAFYKYQKIVNSGYPAPGNDLYTVLFVACYSENEASLRTTIESLAVTEYRDDRKLLFIVADGLITGKGNGQSTPDIVINMIRTDPIIGSSPKPYSYISIASGSKQHNMARVYAGHFVHKDHVVPTIIVVKCGTPNDVGTAKPGNRGKRDSQIILMNFFSRVILNDRMTPLDFDLFRKITHLMEATPDCFEMVVMVDADTSVHPKCLRYMVNAMINDEYIMGLCGETRIANKLKSWVTAIQVFEYYISHHLGKAFESVFGGVTCLPGCFCVYRIQVRKDKDWIPILANPDIIVTYSANEVDTLHQKNLLLLGEDRFLTTFMIRTFPGRKMVFIPNAICKTVVPEDFATLVSQRRRWINSTVHNLMELVLVNSLCGTFCFSMQFIVLLDLISTIVLPASIASTIYFAVHVISRKEFRTTGEIVNISILLMVIFFPIFIVLFSGKRLHYLLWMFIYILALPIWNFVLPLHAFWHFDDFSWGATRKVSGGANEKDGHGDGEGLFDASKISLKRWAEYEKAWRKNLERKITRVNTSSNSNNNLNVHTNNPMNNDVDSVVQQQEGGTDFMGYNENSYYRDFEKERRGRERG